MIIIGFTCIGGKGGGKVFAIFVCQDDDEISDDERNIWHHP